MDESNDASPWTRYALEQARIVVTHLEQESPDPDFVRMHAMNLIEIALGADRIRDDESEGSPESAPSCEQP
jgi:hypothetical protein